MRSQEEVFYTRHQRQMIVYLEAREGNRREGHLMQKEQLQPKPKCVEERMDLGDPPRLPLSEASIWETRVPFGAGIG